MSLFHLIILKLYTLTFKCQQQRFTSAPSSSHRLRPVDIEFMKALQDKVNVIPLIAKADCLTPAEIKKLKERVRGKNTIRKTLITDSECEQRLCEI